MNRFADPLAILDRIQASPYFPQTPEAVPLLRYICARTQAGHGDTLREHDIGVEILGLEPGYDVSANPIVRLLVDEIRVGLRNYFANDGKGEPLRLAIPAGEYRAYFYEARPEELASAQAPAQSAFERFWEPHFQPRAKNMLIHGEVEGRMPVAEAHAVSKLAALFAKSGISLQIHSAVNLPDLDPAGLCLILTGTFANNRVLAEHMNEAPAGATVRRLSTVTIVTGPDAASVLDATRFVTEEQWLNRKAASFSATGFPDEFDLVVRALRD
jgi:hypothetical protein